MIFNTILNLIFFYTLSFRESTAVVSTAYPCKFAEIEVNEDNWEQILTGKWMVKFYAPWCPACRAMEEDWAKLLNGVKHLEYCVASIDVSTSAGLSGRFLVTSLPTIYHAINGEFRMYEGVRLREDMAKFVSDSEWTKLEPIPWYLSPTSYHMAGLGKFFTFSMALRDLHVLLTEDYGIPYYVTYILFALITILIGLIIGVLLVFCCDLMFQKPKKSKVNVAIHKKFDDKAVPKDVGKPVLEEDEEELEGEEDGDDDDDVDDDADDDDDLANDDGDEDIVDEGDVKLSASDGNKNDRVSDDNEAGQKVENAGVGGGAGGKLKHQNGSGEMVGDDLDDDGGIAADGDDEKDDDEDDDGGRNEDGDVGDYGGRGTMGLGKKKKKPMKAK